MADGSILRAHSDICSPNAAAFRNDSILEYALNIPLLSQHRELEDFSVNSTEEIHDDIEYS